MLDVVVEFHNIAEWWFQNKLFYRFKSYNYVTIDEEIIMYFSVDTLLKSQYQL